MFSYSRKPYLTVATILLMLLIYMMVPTEVHAWEAHLNENGDIEIFTVDKKRTGSIWYYTEGVTVTRCAYNPTTKNVHSSGEWFGNNLHNSANMLKNGTEYNVWTISIGDIIGNASAEDPAWGQEIRDAVDGTGPAVYVKLDCIMYVVNDNTHQEIGPFMNVPGAFGSSGMNVTGVNARGQQIANAAGWANPNGLRTHYNHYLLIGKGEEVEPIEFADEFVCYDYTMDHYAGIDENQPAFAMSNFSSEFDLSQGIPSSEFIDNAFLADSWYGNTNVYARTVGQRYNHTMTYLWAVEEGGFNEDGDWESNIVTYSETHMIPIGSAYVAFQYLADTHIYDFTNADVQNGAYDGDHVYYDDTNEVPMTCISTSEYKDVAAHGELVKEEPNWLANTQDHVILGTFSYPSTYDFGLVGGRPDIEGRIIQDRDAIRNIIKRNTRSRNDRFIIDGHMFMDNEWVTGCDFFEADPGTYRACVSSSGWVHDYCLQSGTLPLHEYDPADVTGAVSVQIPATVDNGYYYTSMKVYYQRLITYSKTAAEFRADE